MSKIADLRKITSYCKFIINIKNLRLVFKNSIAINEKYNLNCEFAYIQTVFKKTEFINNKTQE